MSPLVFVVLALLGQVPDAQVPDAQVPDAQVPDAQVPDAGPPAVEGKEIRLGAGTQRVVEFPGLSHVAIGNPSVVDARVLNGRELILVGLGVGESGLMLFRGGRPSSFRVKVVSKDETDGVFLVRDFLAGAEGLEVRTIGSLTFIDGVIGTTEDLENVLKVLALYPTQVRVLAVLDPRLVQMKVAAVNEALVRQGLRDVRATRLGDDLVLEGSVTDETDLKKARAIAEAVFGPLRQGAAALRAARNAPAGTGEAP